MLSLHQYKQKGLFHYMNELENAKKTAVNKMSTTVKNTKEDLYIP